MVGKVKVLFLCTRNSCRSQMAEGFLKHLAPGRYEVLSAGMEPKPIHPLAIKVMEEVGIDIGSQKPTDVNSVIGRYIFAYVIFVCEHAQKNCPRIFPGFGDHAYWPFEDPEGFEGSEEEKLDKFREVRDQIRARIEDWLKERDEQSPF